MWDKETLLQTVQTQFKDHLLVTVSSRQPYGHVMKDGHVVCIRQPGGLVSALDPVMQAVKGLWIAVGDQRYDRQNVDVEGKVKVPPENPSYDLKRIWLSKEEMDQYYFGYANQALWPLCHISYTRPEFSSTDWEGYERVNKKFADAILEGIGDRPAFIWLQDYHLTRVAYYLRKAKRKQKTVIALFWHIPWPNQEVFRICPQRKKILEGLLSTDLIGFHTQYHCTHFLDTVDQELESRIDRERQMITFHKHKTSVRAFPISIDFKRVNALASSADVRKRTKRLSERFDVGNIPLIIGVDRIDYTKGIPDKFKAIERLLELHPELKKKFVFIQQGQESRIHIARYKALNDEINAAVEHINWRFSEDEWSPIIMTRQFIDYQDVLALYRMAKVCLVGSLHDGMNLVAKEFCAARSDLNASLVLSKFTGSAWELADALIINPYNADGVADALYKALTMKPDEVRGRMKRLRNIVKDHNIYRWAARMLSELENANF